MRRRAAACALRRDRPGAADLACDTPEVHFTDGGDVALEDLHGGSGEGSSPQESTAIRAPPSVAGRSDSRGLCQLQGTSRVTDNSLITPILFARFRPLGSDPFATIHSYSDLPLGATKVAAVGRTLWCAGSFLEIVICSGGGL